MIVAAITTVVQLTTMHVISFADINGKESVVAASIIGPALLGSFGIIRIMSNMQHLVADMDNDMKSTNYGSAIQAIPFGALKLVFAALFLVIGIIQLVSVY